MEALCFPTWRGPAGGRGGCMRQIRGTVAVDCAGLRWCRWWSHEALGQFDHSEETAAFLDDEGRTASLVFVTHSETSTGALLDLEGIARWLGSAEACRSRRDHVLGVHEFDFDRWGLAGAVTGSQKIDAAGRVSSWRFPARLERAEEAELPRFYFDLLKARASLNKNTTPFTTGVPLCWRWRSRFRLIEEEGMASVRARHARPHRPAAPRWWRWVWSCMPMFPPMV